MPVSAIRRKIDGLHETLRMARRLPQSPATEAERIHLEMLLAKAEAQRALQVADTALTLFEAYRRYGRAEVVVGGNRHPVKPYITGRAAQDLINLKGACEQAASLSVDWSPAPLQVGEPG